MKFFHEQYKNQIKNLADKMQNEEMPALTEELFALFETTGNRLQYEEVYFARRKFLAVFGIAAYIFKRKEDMVKLDEVLLEICAEECWALPAHVNRRENPDWRNTVDLFASETAQALAEIISLTDGVSADIKRRVCTEIEQRVLIPFEKIRQGWECSDHNWNAVCCGSIGSTAMYLLAQNEEERLERVLQRICHSLTFYLDGFKEDGACMEGIGYFTYGMTYYVGFAEQILRYSDGKINLFENDKVRRIAQFQQKMYFSSGQTVSFSDGDAMAKFRMGLTSFLAGKYNTVEIPDEAFACDFETDPCYRFMGLLRDVIWTTDGNAQRREYVPDKQQKSSFCHVLPHAQWCVCESKSGIGFAIKGGNNGEPHNHNDVGSFLYIANGEQLICDLGAGEYTADYFGPGRYGILCNSSEGHNVPVIGGNYQKDGAQHGASQFEADRAGITVIEFSGAYEEGALHSLTRKTAFSYEDGSLVVEDRFAFREGEAKSFTENLVTKGIVTLMENAAIIRGQNGSCKVQIKNKAVNLKVVEKEHFNHEGEKETVRLIQWDVREERNEHGGISKYIIRCI